MGIFQSTPPARGATRTLVASADLVWYFNPRPPRGGRPISAKSRTNNLYFNPRPPRGGRQPLRQLCPEKSEFQSTPPARRATLTFWAISSVVWISIHAPREGGDLAVDDVSHEMNGFQSTPPARGATSLLLPARYRPINFNPRPPRGGRRAFSLVSYRGYLISIHAPREGGDL